MRENTIFLHDLLRKEIALVGAKNLASRGLSQGCAAALTSVLLWKGESLGAFFGMGGWLLYRKSLQEIVLSSSPTCGVTVTEENPFKREMFEKAPNSPVELAVTFLREELDLLTSNGSLPYQSTPLFLGHGVVDEKVPISLAQEADQCLRAMSDHHPTAGASFHREYAGLSHWYSQTMLKDLASFVLKSLE